MCPGCAIARRCCTARRPSRRCSSSSRTPRLPRRRRRRRRPMPAGARRRRPALRGAPEDLSAARRRAPTARIKWIVLFVTLGIYYVLPFVRWDRGPERARPGGADRFPQPPLLLLLHRDLAAGGLLPHRPADPRGDGAVPDERGRRPGLVRLSLPADGVDRPVPDHRALGRRRPPRAPAARPAAVDRSSGSRAPASSTSSG